MLYYSRCVAAHAYLPKESQHAWRKQFDDGDDGDAKTLKGMFNISPRQKKPQIFETFEGARPGNWLVI